MPSVVINASAGSGKTYALAVEYLRALLLPVGDGRPPRPEQVLATTFTRAAASEILERVLSRLALAVVFEPEREKLLNDIERPDLGHDDLAALLHSLSQALPQLQVGTLDGLFSRIVRVMGTDLAFPTTWTVADETLADELALAAADRMLRGADMELSRAQWQRYAQFKAGTRVRAALAGLLEENRFALLEAGVADDDPELAEPLRLLAEESEQILRDLDAFPDVPLKKDGMPNLNWQNDLAKVRAAFAGEVTWISLLGNTLVHRSGQEDATHRGIAIPSTLRTLLGPAAKKAGDELRRLHEGRLPALAALARRYHEVRRLVAFSAAAYRFPEIEAAARQLPPHLEPEDIYFRLDGQVRHLLLDEFQDTSLGQFRFLWPLIQNVVDNHGLFFAVGDTKQSIYGWRGADRRLLKRLPGFFTPPFLPKSLDTNYRSSPAVLRAVDRVFQYLPEMECLDPLNYKAHEAERATVAHQAAASFTDGFAPHVAAGANRDLPGRVRLIITERPNEEDEPDEVQSSEEEAILAAVERHVHEGDRRQVAVLCRRRFWIPTLIAALRQRGIDASGEGGSPITDSAAVELVLSLLTWLDHPGHTLAAEHVRRSGMLAAFGLDELKADDGAVRRLRIKIMRSGLAEEMVNWIRHPDFLRKCTAHDQVRCEQLVELARHANSGAGSLSRFVARVRSQRLENPISSRVRIMTIHACKGLEFDAVILADLRVGRSGGDGPQFVITLGTPDEIPSVQLLPRRADAEILGLKELYESHEQLRFEEELSVLYVGLTRAKSHLDVIIPHGEKAAPTLERILCEAWEAHEPGEHVIEALEGKATASAETSVPAMPHDPAVWNASASYTPSPIEAVPERLDAITPSGQEGAGNVSLGQLLAAQNAQALERGTAVHALLSRIEWNDALPELTDWLQSIPASEASSSACKREASGLRKRLHAAGDSLREVFDRERWVERWRSAGVTNLQLWRERRFSVVLGQELMNGSFDRVVLGLDARGAPIRAAILDFKTDRIESDEERQTRRLHYKPQLDAYANALGKMIRLPAEAISTQLVWIN